MSANPVSAISSATAVSRKAASIPALADVYAVVADDFAAVNTLIPQRLTSKVNLVEDIGAHIIESGGKRLRPLLVLLGAKAAGFSGTDQVKLAAIIEFLHTATLLHDDVIDRSDRRRGQATANAIWGNAPSVLVGDFLYSRAFQLMVELGQPEILRILSDATNTIAEGEVQQLTNIRNVNITEQEYMQVISRKTAMLFEAASHSAAVLSGATAEDEQALKNYDLHLGLSFQLVDDVLDYQGDTADLGKNVGDDLAEGKMTLPLIIARARGTREQAEFVEQAILNGGVDDLNDMVNVVQDTGGLQYTQELAIKQTASAIESIAQLPDSEFKSAMQTMAEFSTNRSF